MFEFESFYRPVDRPMDNKLKVVYNRFILKVYLTLNVLKMSLKRLGA